MDDDRREDSEELEEKRKNSEEEEEEEEGKVGDDDGEKHSENEVDHHRKHHEINHHEKVDDHEDPKSNEIREELNEYLEKINYLIKEDDYHDGIFTLGKAKWLIRRSLESIVAGNNTKIWMEFLVKVIFSDPSIRNALGQDENSLKAIVEIPSKTSDITYERLRLRLNSVIFHIFGQIELFDEHLVEKLLTEDDFHIEIPVEDQLLTPLSSKKISPTLDTTLLGITRAHRKQVEALTKSVGDLQKTVVSQNKEVHDLKKKIQMLTDSIYILNQNSNAIKLGQKKAHPAKCRAVGNNLLIGIAGQESKFEIVAVNDEGEVDKGGEKFEVTVTDEQGKEVQCKIEDPDTGRYLVKFYAKQGGKHKISVKLRGHPIQWSPYTCKILSNLPIKKVGTQGSSQGQFNQPYGVSVDNQGRIIASDFGNHRIQIFNRNGEFIRSLGKQGSGDGEFLNPVGVHVDRQGNIIVADYENNRIQMFDMNCNFIKKIGAKNQFNHPRNIVQHPNGNYYIIDKENNRIQVFDLNWAYLFNFGAKGSNDGELSNPRGLAINTMGRIIISERDNHRLSVFDEQGRFISKIGIKGSEDGQLNSPAGIAIDNQDNIAVADTGNKRLQLLDKDGNFIYKIDNIGEATDICFDNISGRMVVAKFHELLIF